MEQNNTSILTKLSKIQTEMKAPKNLFNKYGNYNYRNAESILEAFKPFAIKYDVTLTVEDTIEPVMERIYVRAIAKIYDNETGNYVSVSSYAREEETKKGMDACQITGAASSYARKYCLNGLFLLDDTKDEDSDECKTYKDNKIEAGKAKAPSSKSSLPKSPMITKSRLDSLRKGLAQAGISEEQCLKTYNLKKLDDMTIDQYDLAVAKCKDILSKKNTP